MGKGKVSQAGSSVDAGTMAFMQEFLVELRKLTALKVADRGLAHPLPEPEEVEEDAPDTEAGEDSLLDDPDLADGRLRSRKIYHLAAGAINRGHLIPTRPSSCRKVYRYLQKYEVGTVKQMAHSLMLEKKTIGNAIAELMKVKLVVAVSLPRP